MRAMTRKLATGSIAVLCLTSLAACGDEGGKDSNPSGKAPTTSNSPEAKPPKPRGPVLKGKVLRKFPYAAQIASANTSYEMKDGTPVDPGELSLQILMVVKSDLDGRSIRPPGSTSMEFRMAPGEGGQEGVSISLHPATNYFKAADVNAQGEGSGFGEEDLHGSLEAGTPYYVTWEVIVDEGLQLGEGRLCPPNTGEERDAEPPSVEGWNKRCIPVGKVKQPTS
ncbi:hypothetical protein [Streptomyces oceani]|uniref:hypothetical protein n=1 Tax=Streptomyces oceani TaxID=1075402 RepID=UPI001112F8D1|nr:hypothetical protein [Streptomyces oceani]